MKRKEFERVSPESVGIRSADVEALLDRLESGHTEMHGLMLMRRGKICAEGWWQPYAPGLVHGLQSLTKTYAATAVGIACTEGLLKLEDRIIDIFPEESPENPSDNLKRLTVRDVLCMGCGMETMPQPSKDWIRDFLATPVVHTPGTTYMYNSTGSTLLGAIVRKLTGEGLHDYLKPRLFDKLGIDAGKLLWLTMPDGMEIGGGGLLASTEDNLRLMKLYADGGVWDGERILAADYVAKATTLQNASATEARHNPDASDNFVGYGFQIWMCRPEGVYRADGAMGQFAVVCPQKDMIISINETAGGAKNAQKTLDILWDFLTGVGGSEPLPESPDAAARLQHRLSRLSLPAPAFSPYSAITDNVSGTRFRVTQGSFALENPMPRWMSGAPASYGITQFSFDFGPGSCEMTFEQDGAFHAVTVATDGTRRLNTLKLAGTPFSKVYLSGAWHGGTFSVTARWIETCFEKRVDFTFDGDDVTIGAEDTVGGFGPLGNAPKEEIRAVRALL